MKSDQGEMRPVTAFLETTALARPAIAFSLRHNGRSVFSYPAAADLPNASTRFSARSFWMGCGQWISAPGISRLDGFISAAQTGVSGKGRQFFTVNGRPVKEKTMLAAFNNTYQNYLEKSRSPAGVLHISIPPGQIDVNIHPMKLEIRFLDGQRVYQFLQKRHRKCHGRIATQPLADIAECVSPQLPTRPRLPGKKPRPTAALVIFNEPLSSQADDFRVLGQYQDSYIVVEKNGELLIIDQHNARERVLFERLQAGYQAGTAASAQALFPLLLELSPAERRPWTSKNGIFSK